MNSSSKISEKEALETLHALRWPIPAEFCVSEAPDGSNVTRTIRVNKPTRPDPK
jgi:hypothetical protein